MFRTCQNKKCYQPFKPSVNQTHCPKCRKEKCIQCGNLKKIYKNQLCSLCHYSKIYK